MNIKEPIVPQEMEKILLWAKELRNRHYNVPTIIYLIVNEKEDKKWMKNAGDTKLPEVRKIYRDFNSGNRANLLFAIHLDAYRKENDIREGQVVSNGLVVGIARNLDFKNRTFDLYFHKNKKPTAWIDQFPMDDFYALSKGE